MDFFKGIDFGGIKNAVEAGVKQAQNGIDEITKSDLAKNASEAIAGGTANAGKVLDAIGVQDVVNDIQGKVSEGLSLAGKTIEDALHPESGDNGNDDEGNDAKMLIAIFWCMAAVDEQISEEEKDKIRELAKQIDAEYCLYGERLENEVLSRLNEEGEEFGWQSASKMISARAIEALDLSPQDARLLCWNLLAISWTDSISEQEMQFVDYIARKSDVDECIVSEFKNYAKAIDEIEASINVLRESNRPFREVEPFIEEAGNRVRNILSAAQSLVADN